MAGALARPLNAFGEGDTELRRFGAILEEPNAPVLAAAVPAAAVVAVACREGVVDGDDSWIECLKKILLLTRL